MLFRSFGTCNPSLFLPSRLVIDEQPLAQPLEGNGPMLLLAPGWVLLWPRVEDTPAVMPIPRWHGCSFNRTIGLEGTCMPILQGSLQVQVFAPRTSVMQLISNVAAPQSQQSLIPGSPVLPSLFERYQPHSQGYEPAPWRARTPAWHPGKGGHYPALPRSGRRDAHRS